MKKGPHRSQADSDEPQRDDHAHVTPPAPRIIAGRNPPFRREKPEPISEVPGSGHDAHDVESHDPRVLKFKLHFSERRPRMAQNVNAAETQVPGVIAHVEKGDGAGPTLRAVHPV